MAQNFKIIIDKLKRNDQTLFEICIDCPLCKGDIKLLCRLLAQNTVVDTLDFGGNQIGDEAANTIAEMLKENKTVHTLILWFCGIGVEGAKAIADMLKQNDTLLKLQLHSNGVKAKGAKAFAEALKKNTIVETLDLSWNDVGDEGAKSMADMMKQNKTVKILNLYGNGIGNKGMQSLTAALIQNHTIRDLKTGTAENFTVFDLLERNCLLRWSVVDTKIRNIFSGLHAAFGSDVYTCLLVVDCLPHYVTLDRSRKVALLQSFINNYSFS